MLRKHFQLSPFCTYSCDLVCVCYYTRHFCIYICLLAFYKCILPYMWLCECLCLRTRTHTSKSSINTICNIPRTLSVLRMVARLAPYNCDRVAKMLKIVLFFLSVSCSFMAAASAGNFYRDFDLTWGDHRAKILDGGNLLTLSLDQISGSGFQSKREYLFGRIDMQLKLVAGNSAGTVTAYYVSTSIQSRFCHPNLEIYLVYVRGYHIVFSIYKDI